MIEYPLIRVTIARKIKDSFSFRNSIRLFVRINRSEKDRLIIKNYILFSNVIIFCVPKRKLCSPIERNSIDTPTESACNRNEVLDIIMTVYDHVACSWWNHRTKHGVREVITVNVAMFSIVKCDIVTLTTG